MMEYGRAKRVLIKRIGLVAWLGALGLIVLTSLTPGAARAEEDEDRVWSFDKRLFSWMFSGLGPRHRADDPYVYRERPPLVVPPGRVLPPPQASSAVRDPNWPVDPDINRRRDAAEKRKAARQDFDPEQFTNPLRPSELGGGSAVALGDPNRPASDADMTDAMRPSQLDSRGGLFGTLFGGTNGRQEQQVGTIASEPPRRSLTDPPVGYQAPSTHQPYGTSPWGGYGKPTKPEDHAVGDVGL
jgi:hypothetical protein